MKSPRKFDEHKQIKYLKNIIILRKSELLKINQIQNNLQMKKLLITYILFNICILLGYADSIQKYIVTIQPQSLLYHGIKFDLEKHIKHKFATVVSPMLGIYKPNLDDFSTDEQPYTDLKVLGSEFTAKFYTSNREAFYLFASALYHHYWLEYQSYSWESQIFDGNETLIPIPVYVTQNIDKLGLSLGIGGSFYGEENFVIDSYFGFGARMSIYSSKTDIQYYFPESIFDFGYSGQTMIFGIRIGVML